MLPSVSCLMTTPANARLSICAPALVIGMSSSHLALSNFERNTLTVDYLTADHKIFRVLEMAKEFPRVEFRGLDLGAWYPSP